MQTTVHKRHSGDSSRRGFTLIEVLIVLVIISILMALLFPAFQRAQESGRQASCQSNLKQIYLAVNQYKLDEREFPASLAVLLPATTGENSRTLKQLGPTFTHINDRNTDDNYECDTTNDTCPNPSGAGNLPASVLTCPNDDMDDELRSSYGDISTSLATEYEDEDENEGFYLSRYMWNYWGYDRNGVAFNTEREAADFIGTDDDRRRTLLRLGDSTQAFDRRTNPIKNSLSNRYAAPTTIITHCVFHRPQTANDITSPEQLYASGNVQRAVGARDIILRLDGTTKPYDVADFATAADDEPTKWQSQDFN